MAHEIENNKFVGTQVAWHKIGTVVDKAMTSREAMELANLDTMAELQPMFVKDEDKMIEVPNRKAVIRIDDLKILGVVGNGYHIIQNRDCFDFMDSVIGEGRAVYETAGSLREGSQLFLTLKLPTQAKIGPDKIDKYILLSTSHDGSLALRVQWTPVRVVCANTLSVALNKYNFRTNGMCIKHTKSYKNKVAEARKVLELTEEYYRYMEESFNKMLETEMTELEFQQVIDKLFPKPEDVKENSAKMKHDKETILSLFHKGIGHSNIKSTRWAGFNAVTEFVDHKKTIRVRNGAEKDDVRMESVIWGSGYQMKQKAYDILKVK